MAADGIRFRRKILVIFLDQTRSGRAIVILKKKVFWSKPARNGPVWDETVSLAAFAGRCFFGKGFLNLPRPETKRGKLNRIKTSSYSRTNVTWFRFRWIASVAKAYYAWPGPVQWHGWYLSRKLASFASECVAWPMGDNRDKPPALNSRTHHDHHHVAAIYDTIHFRVDRFVISFVSRQAAVDWREMLIRTSGKIWKGNIRIVHAFVRWAQPIQFACQMCHDSDTASFTCIRRWVFMLEDMLQAAHVMSKKKNRQL